MQFHSALKQKILRCCPYCKKRVIQPLDCKKYEPYLCPHCNAIAGVSFINVIGFMTALLLLQHIFYQLNYDVIGHIVWLMIFLYWCFSTKIDALLFPLIEVDD